MMLGVTGAQINFLSPPFRTFRVKKAELEEDCDFVTFLHLAGWVGGPLFRVLEGTHAGEGSEA